MKILDEVIEAERQAAKTFHPVRERSSDAWFPGNEAASLIVQARHIWDDIEVLAIMRSGQDDQYRKKLLLKYVVIEVRSLIEVFDRLQALVMRAPTFDPRKRQGFREITVAEKEKARELLKNYSDAKKKTSKVIIDIRNTICAHRGNLDWQKVMLFWDAVTPDLVNPVLKAVPKAFEYIKELDLFDWNRALEDGAIEFISSCIRPEYFQFNEQSG